MIPTLFLNLGIYAFAFFLIWFGAGLIISSTGKFSKKLKLSPFIFSFAFLGLLTSTPEFSVGLQAVGHNDPEIFVGNLLGGIIVLFLVVMPILAVFGNGISLKREMDHKTLLLTLGVVLAPSVAVLDKTVTNSEGIILILSYLGLLVWVERKKGIFDSENTNILNLKAYSYEDILKVIGGIALVFLSSSLIVDKTLYFAETFNMSAFYISLIVVALGTDLPEIILAARSIASGKKEIAMGDYIGAAAASTILFGLFTVLSNGEVLTESRFSLTFVFIAGTLTVFYIISLKKNFISRKYGILMLGAYLLFVYLELLGS